MKYKTTLEFPKETQDSISMIIKPMKVLNLKGNFVDLEIKNNKVQINDKWKVKYFIEHLNYINDIINYADNINNEIQDYISDISYKIKPISIQIINNGLQDLTKYFNLEQLKYFKILAISSISKDYHNGFRARLMKEYYK